MKLNAIVEQLSIESYDELSVLNAYDVVILYENELLNSIERYYLMNEPELIEEYEIEEKDKSKSGNYFCRECCNQFCIDAAENFELDGITVLHTIELFNRNSMNQR